MGLVDGGPRWGGKGVQVWMDDDYDDEMIFVLAFFVGYWACVRFMIEAHRRRWTWV